MYYYHYSSEDRNYRIALSWAAIPDCRRKLFYIYHLLTFIKLCMYIRITAYIPIKHVLSNNRREQAKEDRNDNTTAY